MKRKALWVVIAAVAASAVLPFAANAANASRYPSWSGTSGDYTDPAMWYEGIVADAAGDCANLSRGRRLAYSGNQVRLVKKGMYVIVR